MKNIFNKRNFSIYLKEYLMLFVISIAILLFWMYLEIFINGSVNENTIDTIIGVLFTWSIYINIKLYQIIKNKNNKIKK